MNKQYLLSAEVPAPPLPDWLLERALKTLSDSQAQPQSEIHQWDTSYVERVNVRQGQPSRNAFNRSLYLDSECVAWAQVNIDANIVDMRIVSTDPGCEHKGPHVDLTRQYTGIYLLESGGPDHLTCFYQDKNLPGLECPPGHYLTDFDQADAVCCVKLKLEQWHLLNAHILHGVENISLGRVALQFSINNISTIGYKNSVFISA